VNSIAFSSDPACYMSRNQCTYQPRTDLAKMGGRLQKRQSLLSLRMKSWRNVQGILWRGNAYSAAVTGLRRNGDLISLLGLGGTCLYTAERRTKRDGIRKSPRRQSATGLAGRCPGLSSHRIALLTSSPSPLLVVDHAKLVKEICLSHRDQPGGSSWRPARRIGNRFVATSASRRSGHALAQPGKKPQQPNNYFRPS